MICVACGKLIQFPDYPQRHHRYADTKSHRELYGRGNDFDGIDWINNPINVMFPTCGKCNESHRKGRNQDKVRVGSGLIIWNEIQFCRSIPIRPRSKAYQFKAV